MLALFFSVGIILYSTLWVVQYPGSGYSDMSTFFIYSYLILMKRNLLLVYCVVLTLVFLFIPLLHVHNVGGNNLGFEFYVRNSNAGGDHVKAWGYMTSFFAYILIFVVLLFRWVKMVKWLSLLTFVSPIMAVANVWVANDPNFSNAGSVVYILLNTVFVILCLMLKSSGRSAGNGLPEKTPCPDTVLEYDRDQDIAQNKGIGVCAYLGILVLIPLFGGRNSKFVRFHANQGLVLLVCFVVWFVLKQLLWYLYVICVVAGDYEPGLQWRLFFLNRFFSLGYLLLAALAVTGIVNVLRGREKRLPLIGKIRLLK